MHVYAPANQSNSEQLGDKLCCDCQKNRFVMCDDSGCTKPNAPRPSSSPK